jgi:DNA polymerase elongation subunit (family B)
MAICAYARKALLDCLHFAEEKGFEVIHAIVDSIYITKPNMTREDVEEFYRELEQKIGIPVSFEGVFKWIVFLASRVDPDRALPATYFGVFVNGETKVRGLELRQRAVPKIIKAIQEEALRLMKECSTKENIREKIPYVCEYVRRVLAELSQFKPSLLTSLICISKTEYKHNIPQKVIVDKLAKKGVNLNPGQFIEFIYSTEGPVLPEEYKNNPDKIKYKKLAVRALTVLFEPFGFTRKQIFEYISNEQQGEFNFDTIEPVLGVDGQIPVSEVEYFETIGG